MFKNETKLITLVVLIAGLTSAQYVTELHVHRFHLVYQALFFIPIFLSGFWFGLRGALTASLTITMLLIPFTFIYWKGFSIGDVNNGIELILYNVVAVILGTLKGREEIQRKRLQDSERLVCVGKAVSGLAHDLRTPLTAIGSILGLIKKHFDENHRDNHTLGKMLEVACAETQRLDSMTREVLDFSSPLKLRCSTEDFTKTLRHIIELLSDTAKKRNVALQLQTPANLEPISIDRERMEQALINILTNAVGASPEGESVTVYCHQKGQNLIIDVTDRGCGIPYEKREEIFLPFVTTKHGGTGLGLPIVKKIVEAHQGSLKILDNPDKGLTFRMAIPILPCP